MPEVTKTKAKHAVKIVSWDITTNELEVQIKSQCTADELSENLVGETVEVSDPEDPVNEGYNYGFLGTVKALKGNYATVADQDENYFSIEVSKLAVMVSEE